MQNPQAILTQILTIIDYPDDKQAFIDDFSDLCIKKGLEIATQSLSDAKKEELVKKIKDITDQKIATEIIGQYVPVDDYEKAVGKAATDFFENFLETIDEDLTDAQSDALDTYLASIEEKSDESSSSQTTED